MRKTMQLVCVGLALLMIGAAAASDGPEELIIGFSIDGRAAGALLLLPASSRASSSASSSDCLAGILRKPAEASAALMSQPRRRGFSSVRSEIAPPNTKICYFNVHPQK